jgi:hypothetical protein
MGGLIIGIPRSEVRSDYSCNMDRMGGVYRCKKKPRRHAPPSRTSFRRSPIERVLALGFSCGVFRCQTGGPRPYDRYVAGNFVHEITGFVFSLLIGDRLLSETQAARLADAANFRVALSIAVRRQARTAASSGVRPARSSYWRTADIVWADFSDWLVTVGVIFGYVTLVVALIEIFVLRTGRLYRPNWFFPIGMVVALILATFNMLVHTRDAWTSVVLAANGTRVSGLMECPAGSWVNPA